MQNPIAFVEFVQPARPPPFNKVTEVLNRFELNNFSRDTSNTRGDLYQILIIPFQGMMVFAAIFPGEYLAELTNMLRPYGLAPVPKVITVSSASGTETLDINRHVMNLLQISVGDRVYWAERK